MSRRTSRLTGALGRESKDLLRYFRRRVVADDAADLLAETAIVAWRREVDLPEDTVDARRWLFGVARHVLLNYQRGERRRLALADRVRDLLVRVAPAAAPADDGIEVRDAISRLSPELAEVVQLIHWDGLTVTDVAAVTDVSPSTARARYRRAREELRETLTTNVRSR